MNRKTIRLVGYLLMVLGVSLPLYSFSSLSLNKYYEKVNFFEFVKSQENVSIDEVESIGREAVEYNHKLNDDVKIIDPFDNVDYKTEYDLKDFKGDDVFAYIRIPAIDLYQPIRLDATESHLALGAAHIDGTSLPVGGVGTRSVIAGHRGWFDNIMFLNVSELKAGDDVYVDVLGKTLLYKVKDSELIKPNEWEKLAPVKNKDVLTILTCDPVTPPFHHRLLVNCERFGEEKLDINKISAKSEKKSVFVENKRAKYTKFSIYFITFLLWLLMAWVIFRFIRFVLKMRKQ